MYKKRKFNFFIGNLLVIICAFLVSNILMNQTVEAEIKPETTVELDAENYHPTGEDLRDKLVLTKNNEIVQGYRGEYKTGIDSSGQQYGAYVYPLTDLKPNQVGSVYLEDRLDLAHNFQMNGYINFSKATGSSKPADGIGVVFHQDDTKYSGKPGEELGIGGLYNGVGLAIDIYKNSQDPTSRPYTQIWTTDATGKKTRQKQYEKYDKDEVINNSVNHLQMTYDAKTRILTYQIYMDGRLNTHSIVVPAYMDYVYFSSSAATGEYYAGQKIAIESIDYVPYRSREIVYRDENMNIIDVPDNQPKVGTVGQEYELEPNVPVGYDVASIQGNLKDTFKFEEKNTDKFVYMNLEKHKKASQYTLDIKESDMVRKNNTIILQPKLEQTVVNSMSNSETIKSIEVKLPKGISISNETFPKNIDSNNWHKIAYEIEDGNVIQYVLTDLNGISQSNNGMTSEQTDYFLKNLTLDISEDVTDSNLDQKVVTYDLNSRAMASYEENGIKNYYEVMNNYSIPVPGNESGESIAMKYNSAESNSNNFVYRGMKGHLAAGASEKEKQFINNLVKAETGSTAWIDKEQTIPFHNNTNLSDVKRYVVKYSPKEVLTGVNDTTGHKETGFPQPMSGNLIDNEGRKLSEAPIDLLADKSYRINDVVLGSEKDIPKIENYTFDHLGQSVFFPVRASAEFKEIDSVYRSLSPTMTTRYLQLDRNGDATSLPVYKVLFTKERQDSIQKPISPGSSIAEYSPPTTFEGYTFEKEKTKIVTDKDNKPVIGDRAPETNFTVTYYYQPMENIRVPNKLSFGDHNKDEYNIVYGVKDDSSTIKVVNTYEGNDWSLMASTQGMKSEQDGSSLNADIFYKQNGHKNIISNDIQPMTNKTNEVIEVYPLSSEDEQDGLYVNVKQDKKTKSYKGKLKFSLQNAP